MRRFLLMALALAFATITVAQRQTDKLDRGLVAVKTSTGVYLSWRIYGEEYYDVQYNVYRNGTLLTNTPLDVSNYQDRSGTTSSKYTVSAVVRGVEQPQCEAVTPWAQQYMEVPLQRVISRSGKDITSQYDVNDASVADLDGDGVMEILLKRRNITDADNLFPTTSTDYDRLEAYKLDGTLLWSIDVGPNTISSGSVETNIVAYDWDGDGKAEVIARIGDGGILHMADGTDKWIGAANASRNACLQTANMTYQITGAEYLVYLEGTTGKPYSIASFPCERGITDDWGDGYGHRSNKFFFGAPFLDGRNPSIFIGRGIYTKHYFKAFDVNPTTHTLNLRWTWRSDGLDGSWFGQGYHNYGIADVDWDGRDEIVYGSMIIDDNGKGLSTTGLGHGDAQHCSDLDPYRHGQEIFACNENAQGSNYRDATTSKIYFYQNIGRDCGRAMAGNFYNTYPGSQCNTVSTPFISCVTNEALPISATGVTMNFRIYWDGDLCEESLDGDATEGNAVIQKGGVGAIFSTSNTKLCNWTKNTPTCQADIFGDWREELILRTADNSKLRIYTTTDVTKFRNYTLWHDHQYRQGMVWEMCGYNQPPHTSYFLGELEGITIAPPPLTMTDRTEVANNSTIGAEGNDKHLIMCETKNMTVDVIDGASPYILTVNAPTWVQGNNNNNSIRTTTYTHTITGGAFTGFMRLIKQGDGILQLPNVVETYSGETNVWAGTLNFDGTLQNSPLWLNRFAELNSDGGKFMKGITMEYDSKVRPGGNDNKGTIETDGLVMNMGSRLILDLYSEGQECDQIIANSFQINKKTWQYGPKYLTPVFEFVPHLQTGKLTLESGKYPLMIVKEIGGNITDVILEGISGEKASLEYTNDTLYLVVEGIRDASSIVWTGESSNIWDFANTMNFKSEANEKTDFFVTNDKVIFNDDATKLTITLKDELVADTVLVTGSKSYTFSGNGYLSGTTTLVKEGTGTLTINNENTYTGGTRISGGTLKVASLSNQNKEKGSLGGMTTSPSKFIIENGGVLLTTSNVEMGSPIQCLGTEGGVINNSADFTMDKAFSGTILTKRGTGWLKPSVASTLQRLVVEAGTVSSSASLAKQIELRGTSALTGNGFLSTPIYVDKKAKAQLTTVNRQTTNLALTGDGQITVYCATEKGNDYYATRTPIQLNMKNFKGTLIPEATYAESGVFTFDTNAGGDGWALNIPAGRTVLNSAKTFRIGTLIGSGNIGGFSSFANNGASGTNSWQVGNDEANFTFDGKVVGGDSFIKLGTDKMTIKGKWETTGAVNVNGGELHVNNNTSLGTGTLTIAKGASLTGVGELKNSTVTVNGTIQVGASSSSATGTLDMGGKNVTFSTTGVLLLGARKGSTESTDGGAVLKNINKLTMRGTIQVFLSSSATLNEGDCLRLFTANSFTGSPTFILPEGYEWDTSRISEGLIFVTAVVDSIGAVTVDGPQNDGAIYTITGLKVGNSFEGLKPGIYVRNGKKVLVK